MITLADVNAATGRVDGYLRRTPMQRAGTNLWFKLEYLQHGGSFKARGMFNRLLSARESGELDPSVGVVTASGGNAGVANAYAARQVGVPATVFVPETVPAAKLARLQSLGAQVVQHGSEYAEAFEAASKHAVATGAVFCHAYDQAAMAAGAGTIGLEILEDLGNVDTVLIAVGGGGLMAGVAAALEGTARVVGVEPVTCPSLTEALTRGGPVNVAVSGVAADSLGARRLGDIAYAVAVRTGVEPVRVDDAAIVAARRWLWDEHRILVEHGAAATVGALHSGAYVPAADERTAIVLCGANTDPGTL